ncbi:uncharacterized protein K489DRAFT_243875 [Dissoconium aciculare CBS 342.82]|uniref:Uncharacterized protein n=1 Tax=Dissoconium aciculare CBS 342.82 TaxID=1314786 RepID=A0A6J3M388_9PEZI|nr:uncharacterized protein K489DRAFT_243875 [Dissoconium aciculare CBS 342.82]KAF1822455.1 hypothetical protein K489DRAFT_243875 [Dissoconium aciculare CBS 342.82]
MCSEMYISMGNMDMHLERTYRITSIRGSTTCWTRLFESSDERTTHAPCFGKWCPKPQPQGIAHIHSPSSPRYSPAWLNDEGVGTRDGLMSFFIMLTCRCSA